MWCPHCGMDTRVVKTDKAAGSVVRVRWCRNRRCCAEIITEEVVRPAAQAAPNPEESNACAG